MRLLIVTACYCSHENEHSFTVIDVRAAGAPAVFCKAEYAVIKPIFENTFSKIGLETAHLRTSIPVKADYLTRVNSSQNMFTKIDP